MFKTLFSRMLATYLSVMLGLLILFGVTVGAAFRSQYISEKQAEMEREAREIGVMVTERYVDAEKRTVAERELLTTARKYDAMIIIQFADQTLGRCVFMDEGSAAKWAGCADMDTSAITAAILRGEAGLNIMDDFVGGSVDIPVMTLTGPITDAAGTNIAALILHTDTSRVQESVRQVFMDVMLYSCIGLLLAMMAVSYITGRITKPITDMNAIVRRYAKGEFELRVPDEGSDEVAQLGKSFNAMAGELNTLEAARRSFVANVSHELRSPLTSMRGFLEAMQDGTIPPEEQGRYLDIVINENRRMTSMVNDLLDLARIESGQVVIKKEVFDINELIARILLTFEARIDAKAVQVELDLKGDKLYVSADAGQIAQVLRNLIDNALKFTPEGGLLRLSSGADRKTVTVRVRDSGKGIAPEAIPHLFERFYKEEKAHTPGESAGTGLGLAIVKRIIDQHGQEIYVESRVGEGACFSFTLLRAAEPRRKDGSRQGA